jgi:hypothetical protein
LQHLFLRCIDVDRHDICAWSHDVVRPFLLEIENAREHGALRLVELSVRMRVHHQCAQFIRRMRWYVVLHDLRHPNSACHKIRHRVHDYYERSENATYEPHHRYRITSRKSGVLPGDRPGHHFPNYYMKENSEREPGRAANYSEPDCEERAADPRCRRRRRASVLIIDRNAQGGFGRREERARQHQGNDPDQPGRDPAGPVLDW